jgi:hypothetical protein
MKTVPDLCYLDLKDFVRWNLDKLGRCRSLPVSDPDGPSGLLYRIVDQFAGRGEWERAYQYLMVFFTQGGESMVPGSMDELTRRFQGIGACDLAVMNYWAGRYRDVEAN